MTKVLNRFILDKNSFTLEVRSGKIVLYKIFSNLQDDVPNLKDCGSNYLSFH